MFSHYNKIIPVLSFTREFNIYQKTTDTANYFRRENWVFFNINLFFLISSSSKDFILIVFLNQLLRVLIVNFSSTEESSVRDVDFLLARTAVVASFC